MTLFSYIFILSFFTGFFAYQHKNDNLCSLIIFLKGLLTLHLASIINNTGLSLLVAAVGLYSGHVITSKRKQAIREVSIEYLFLGILLRFSPLMAGFSLLLFLFIYQVTKKRYLTRLTTSIILLIFLYLPKKPDSLIILGYLILLNSLLQFITDLEKKKDSHSWFLDRALYTRILITTTLIGICLLLFFNRYVYKGFGMQEDIIRHGPREFNCLTITFDDGPHPEYTPDILDILKEKEVKATFFLIGQNAEKYPEIVKRILNEGHSIGNHTYSHRSLIPLSQKNTEHEILKGESVIQEITGEKPTLFRPPRGIYSDYARELLKENRYTIVLWDVSSQDWRELRYNNIITNILKSVQNGSILLFHDSGDLFSSSGGDRINTVKALPLIIDQLHALGYELITIHEMLILKGLAEREEFITELIPDE